MVRSHRRVMHGPVGPHNKLALYALPPIVRTEKQLTAPADRPVRESAHAVAFTTAVAVGGSASVHRRTGMRAARALHGDRNGPGSPPTNAPSQNRPPTSPVNHMRCSAEHRPAWRCDAGPDVRRAVGVCLMGRARGSHLTSGIWQGTGTLWHPVPQHPVPQEGGEDDTERTARARGVSRGEPAESHAARS